MTGQINYGGRVTDDNDRVLVTHLLRRCYSPSVLMPDFSFAPDGAYAPPPPDADLDSCISHIQGLPATDTAQVFSMHANADTAFQLQVTLIKHALCKHCVSAAQCRFLFCVSFLYLPYSHTPLMQPRVQRRCQLCSAGPPSTANSASSAWLIWSLPIVGCTSKPDTLSTTLACALNQADTTPCHLKQHEVPISCRTLHDTAGQQTQGLAAGASTSKQIVIMHASALCRRVSGC